MLEKDFHQVEKLVYKKCSLKYSLPKAEEEGIEYGAGTFQLENKLIKVRSSKITPKKVGQFVTLWIRNSKGITQPHNISDATEIFTINSRKDDLFGQFIFPIEVLEKHGIIASERSKGKRGFRVYPPWDKAVNAQAMKTQSWQLGFFLIVDENTDLNHAKRLYHVD